MTDLICPAGRAFQSTEKASPQKNMPEAEHTMFDHS